ncbi:hypothetical protein DPMN_145979 [Dreissena polymorpha]|uniref:Uncharacterized protein n=1 Tax=Dreissena polymorpha TaxID=45954 RepID=A0A9D4FAY5_DREPO|nr:hypothetical protein DPMN_145979 [Dreissena polymorpha]
MTYSGNDEFFMKMSFTDGTDATLQGHSKLYVTKNSTPKFTNLNSKYLCHSQRVDGLTVQSSEP